MASFTDVFGGQTVPPSEPSLTRIDLAADGALAWPDNFSGTVVDEHLASSIVEVSLSAPFVLSLPPADRASVGTDILIRNVGSAQLSVIDAEGGAVTVVDPGESKYFYVQVNLTAAGIWQVFTYGTGTSGADASLLAGMGLQADTGNKLQLYVEYRSVNSDTDIVVEDRAKIVEIVAGAVTVTLPQASEAENGFSVMLRNSSDGGVVVDGFGSEQVDGALNKTLFPGESCVLVCNGTYWISVGYGRDAEFMFSEVVVDASLSNITLTSSEVAGRMIRVAGVATGNVTITLPTVDNIYFVSVESGVGGFQVELKTSLPGSSVSLAAGQSTILYCDGSNVGIAINTALVSTLNLEDGSAAAPSIRYSLDSDTGLFRSAAGQVSFSSNGVATAGFNGSGLFSTTTATADSTTKAATTAFVQDNFTGRSITAGDGLTGGGTLATSRTLMLGTPTTLTTGTANAVTATSHTHEVTFPVTSVAGKTGAVSLAKADVGLSNVTNDAQLPLTGGTVSGNVTFGSLASGTTVGPTGMTIGTGTATGANTQIIVTPNSGALGRDSQILFGATFSDGWVGPDTGIRYSGAIRFGASGGTADPRSWTMRILTGEDLGERLVINAGAAIFQPAVYAPAFVGPLIGNADTASTLSANRSNYNDKGSSNAVVGQLGWQAYGNDHTIFDASYSKNPLGGVCDATDAAIAWAPSYPCLMGFNGVSTHGVRVDSSRYADVLRTARTINGVAFDGSANINIIERGSNANGAYIRFADGTQICMVRFTETSSVTATSGSSYVSVEYFWNFPAAFAYDSISVSGCVIGTGACTFRLTDTLTTTEAKWRLHSSVAGTFNNPRVFAIGRWK